MFPSPCSLRSTQCAALIALAAAAGIMRIEPARPERAPEPGPDAETVTARPEVGLFDATQFRVQESVAPWLQFIQLASELVAAADAQVVRTISPPLEASARSGFTFSTWAPSARQHSFPFAVGPPASNFNWTPRADDTQVSGDSVARRGFVSRIASDLRWKVSARTARSGNPGLITGAFFPTEFRPARRTGANAGGEYRQDYGRAAPMSAALALRRRAARAEMARNGSIAPEANHHGADCGLFAASTFCSLT